MRSSRNLAAEKLKGLSAKEDEKPQLEVLDSMHTHARHNGNVGVCLRTAENCSKVTACKCSFRT